MSPGRSDQSRISAELSILHPPARSLLDDYISLEVYWFIRGFDALLSTKGQARAKYKEPNYSEKSGSQSTVNRTESNKSIPFLPPSFLPSTTVLSQWDFSHRKFGLPSPGKPAATESRYTTYSACWVFSCFHNPPNFDMDYGIFNVHTHVNACDCTRGCTDTGRESALKADSGRKIPCRTARIEPESATCRSDALATELHPHP